MDRGIPAGCSIIEAIGFGTNYLKQRGIGNARLEAEVLLAHVLKAERIILYMEADALLGQKDAVAYQRALAKRGENTPSAYITGLREFYSMEFIVDEKVLIPRPETEHLVDWVLGLLSKGTLDGFYNILDLGTGSGAIAVALGHNLLNIGRSNFRIYAVDISPEALSVAEKNIRKWQMSDYIELNYGDLYGGLPEVLAGHVAVVVSNPPYIASGELQELSPDVRLYEPLGALDGGEKGLDYYRPILAGAKGFLRPGGAVALEIGDGQGHEVVELARELHYDNVGLHLDYAGKERMVTALWDK